MMARALTALLIDTHAAMIFIIALADDAIATQDTMPAQTASLGYVLFALCYRHTPRYPGITTTAMMSSL